jgi:hypothetical protein
MTHKTGQGTLNQTGKAYSRLSFRDLRCPEMARDVRFNSDRREILSGKPSKAAPSTKTDSGPPKNSGRVN